MFCDGAAGALRDGCLKQLYPSRGGVDFSRYPLRDGKFLANMTDHRPAPGGQVSFAHMVGQNLFDRQRTVALSGTTVDRDPLFTEAGNAQFHLLCLPTRNELIILIYDRNWLFRRHLRPDVPHFVPLRVAGLRRVIQPYHVHAGTEFRKSFFHRFLRQFLA